MRCPRLLGPARSSCLIPLALVAGLLSACRIPAPPGPDEGRDLLSAADLADGQAAADQRVPADLRPQIVDLTPPGPDLPPRSCFQRNPGVTAMHAVVRIDQYKGLITGRNGTHEIAEGTITRVPWIYDAAIKDTNNVELAMNVKDAMDPNGLPMEIPLKVGQVIEVEGEYIPAATSGAKNNNGPAAVLHYTHAPCGFVLINGTYYF